MMIVQRIKDATALSLGDLPTYAVESQIDVVFYYYKNSPNIQ